MLYGCEAWSLILRKRGAKARSIRKQDHEASIWLKRDENGEWRKLQNEKHHSLYRSLNIFRVITSRRMRWAGHVARMEKGRCTFKILTGTLTGKRLLGRPRRKN